MKFFRQINKRAWLLWSLWLFVALPGVQGAKLHVHDLDHGHNDLLNHIHVNDEADDHAHLSKVHSTHDTSHNDHHEGVISEFDFSPDGVLKNADHITFAIAPFVFLFTLLMFVSSQQLIQRCRESKLVLYGYYVLSPPLRAPPPY